MLRTGIDLVHIAKMKKMLQNEAALKRVFHSSELETTNKKSNTAEHLAGIFAAKEALFKAIGTTPQWLDVEVIHEISGKPKLNYSSDLTQKIQEADVSISHDEDYAIASVVLILKE